MPDDLSLNDSRNSRVILGADRGGNTGCSIGTDGIIDTGGIIGTCCIISTTLRSTTAERRSRDGRVNVEVGSEEKEEEEEEDAEALWIEVSGTVIDIDDEVDDETILSLSCVSSSAFIIIDGVVVSNDVTVAVTVASFILISSSLSSTFVSFIALISFTSFTSSC